MMMMNASNGGEVGSMEEVGMCEWVLLGVRVCECKVCVCA